MICNLPGHRMSIRKNTRTWTKLDGTVVRRSYDQEYCIDCNNGRDRANRQPRNKDLKRCHFCGDLKPVAKFTLSIAKDHPRCDDCFSERKYKKRRQTEISSTTFGDYRFAFESDLKFWHHGEGTPLF